MELECPYATFALFLLIIPRHAQRWWANPNTEWDAGGDSGSLLIFLATRIETTQERQYDQATRQEKTGRKNEKKGNTEANNFDSSDQRSLAVALVASRREAVSRISKDIRAQS